MQDSRSIREIAHIAHAKQYAADKARHRLYAAIREAYEEGITLRVIADAAGLSFSRIHQIVTS